MGQGMPMVMTTAPCPLRISGDYFARNSLRLIDNIANKWKARKMSFWLPTC